MFRLRTNLQVLESTAVLNKTNRRLANTQLRLATALRVNKAEDDAASFSIGAKLSSRIAGLEQALQNASDAKSVLDIAEANLTKIQDLLIDIKRIANRGANGTDGADERQYLRQQINGISNEINAIIDSTVYNGINLLDGEYDARFQVGERVSDTIQVTIDQDLTAQDLQVLEVSTFGRLTTNGSATLASSINAFDQWRGVQAGDTFDIILTQGDGTQLAPITITAAGSKGQLTTTTIGDIVSAINGTGLFVAEFNTSRQSIDVTEVVPVEGNSLSVRFANYTEFPGLDGAIGNFSFSFDAATGDLVTNFTSSGAIGAGTQLNNLNQFSDLEGQDRIDITLQARDGTVEHITFILPGASASTSNATVGALRDAINTGSSKFTAVVQGGQIRLQEVNLPQANLLASTNFTAVNLDTGPASVSTVNFTQSATEAFFSGVGAATQINGSFLGSGFREGDQFTIQLRRNNNTTTNLTYTFSSATDTFGQIQAAINANPAFEAAFEGGNLVVREANTSSGTGLRARLQSYLQNGVTFNNTDFDIDFFNPDTAVFLNGGDPVNAGTLLRNTTLGEGFVAGDQFTVRLRNADGTVTRNITYTFASDSDTVGNLITAINSAVDTATEFEAAINGSELVIIDRTGAVGGSFSARLDSFSSAPVSFSTSTTTLSADRVSTSLGRFSPAGSLNAGTLLNSLNQFTNVQGGDTLFINLTNALGQNRSFTFTFAGAAAGPSTSTIGDLVAAISAQADMQAVFDTNISAIVIQDTNNSGGGVNFSFSNAGFTEDPRPDISVLPSPPLSFTYANEGMQSQQLLISGSPAGINTRINDLDGFANIRGNDQLSVTLRTRAGASQTFTFTFNDVAPGTDSNLRVSDLVNFIDNLSIGSIQFEASYSNGRILIQETNPPAVGGLGTSTSFTEFNIDITPKSFSTFAFNITDYLRVSDDTGLVIGLGLIDLDAGNEFTQAVAAILMENVDDSITRVVSVLNDLGIQQQRLSIREEALQNAILANNATRSRLLDTNFAKEASDAVRLQILQQFQTAALAQANLLPVSILSFL